MEGFSKVNLIYQRCAAICASRRTHCLRLYPSMNPASDYKSTTVAPIDRLVPSRSWAYQRTVWDPWLENSASITTEMGRQKVICFSKRSSRHSSDPTASLRSKTHWDEPAGGMNKKKTHTYCMILACTGIHGHKHMWGIIKVRLSIFACRMDASRIYSIYFLIISSARIRFAPILTLF